VACCGSFLVVLSIIFPPLFYLWLMIASAIVFSVIVLFIASDNPFNITKLVILTHNIGHTIVLCFCCVCLHLGNPMLPVSLDCPFSIAPSVLSNVYFIEHDSNFMTSANSLWTIQRKWQHRIQDTGQINVREYRRGNQKWTIQRNTFGIL
jgi:hypothetical protein